MISQEFIIDKKKKIYLYGENPTSFNARNMLGAYHYTYGGLIDRKFINTDDSQNKIAIRDIQKFDNIDNTIFVLCLSDGVKHAKIAENLNSYGVENIIYYPTEENVSYEYAHVMRKAYVDFMCGDIKDITYMLPSYSLMHANKDIIRRTSNNVHFFCEINLLYCATETVLKSTINEIEKPLRGKLMKYVDIPLTDLRPATELFQYLSGRTDSNIESYLSVHRSSELEKKELLENRKKLFEIFEYKYKYERSFFADSPSKVVWNNAGHFNVIDGTHRALYLYSKGVKKVPVVCSENDFREYRGKVQLLHLNE